ncbi:MAG: hypothetical protein WBF34_07205 [Streptosporangiaceae bacterium]
MPQLTLPGSLWYSKPGLILGDRTSRSTPTKPITYSGALALAGVYVPFTGIGGELLRMLTAARSITISDADGGELTGRFRHDAAPSRGPAALRRLRDHGFRLFTLTDNTLEISGRLLEEAA